LSTRLVSELIQDLRERADIEGMTVRHPDTSLRRYLTQSLRSLRAMLTRAGADVFLEGTVPANLPTSAPVLGEQYVEVAWPTGAVSIHGIDILAGTDRWWPLKPVSFADRRDAQLLGGPPRAFCIQTVPKTAQSPTITAGRILIFPLDTTGYTHRVWYLPEFPELVSDSHAVHGFEGDWLEWAVWDATIKVAAKDDDSQNVDQIALRERAMLQERITTNINRVQRAGPVSPRRANRRR
jgi:hypothetical protein